MATVTRGLPDDVVMRVKAVLDEYESRYPGATAELYRQNPASIRIKIVDDRFAGRPKGQRHDEVWDFLAARLNEDDMQDISVLLPLATSDLRSSLMNLEFEHPTDSKL